MFDLPKFISNLVRPQRDRGLFGLFANWLGIDNSWVDLADSVAQLFLPVQNSGWLGFLVDLIDREPDRDWLDTAADWLGGRDSDPDDDGTNPLWNWLDAGDGTSLESLESLTDSLAGWLRQFDPDDDSPDLNVARRYGGPNGGYFDLTFETDVTTLLPDWSRDNVNGIRALDGDDAVFGSPERDFVFGNRGSDNLMGWAGDDILWGGKEPDAISGGDGNDGLNGNIGDDLVLGEAGNDTLNGGKDDDVLEGGDGDDILSGDFGRDILTGGAGADDFILRANTTAGQTDPLLADAIADFDPAERDRIIIEGEFGFADLQLQAIALKDLDGDDIGSADLDTIIRRASTQEVLGVVIDRAGADVQSAIAIV